MPSNTRQLEKLLEAKCVKYAESLSYDSVKLDLAKRDYPDRLFFGVGAEIILVEFKREGEKPRPRQLHIHDIFRGRGFKVHVIDNFDDFKELLT